MLASLQYIHINYPPFTLADFRQKLAAERSYLEAPLARDFQARFFEVCFCRK